jgi:hypothetical protein
VKSSKNSSFGDIYRSFHYFFAVNDKYCNESDPVLIKTVKESQDVGRGTWDLGSWYSFVPFAIFGC